MSFNIKMIKLYINEYIGIFRIGFYMIREQENSFRIGIFEQFKGWSCRRVNRIK